MKLIQKQGFKHREFELFEEVVKVKLKTTSGIKEWTVKLENLGDQTTIEIASRKSSIIAGSFLTVFAVFVWALAYVNKDQTVSPLGAGVIGFCFFIYAIFVFLVPVKREIHLVGGIESLTFFLGSPSKNEVANFIEEIKLLSKKILLNKYGTVDPDLPEETMMNQLNWLKNRNVITQPEYDFLKDEYKTKKLIK